MGGLVKHSGMGMDWHGSMRRWDGYSMCTGTCTCAGWMDPWWDGWMFGVHVHTTTVDDYDFTYGTHMVEDLQCRKGRRIEFHEKCSCLGLCGDVIKYLNCLSRL